MIYERVDRSYKKGSIDSATEIELNKQMSRTMVDIRAAIKSDECFYCHSKVSSFCNSHNIPRFCLENIGINGEVSGFNSIIGLPKMGISIGKENIGINESGTFSLICKSCDSTIFQDYENPDNYLPGKKPSQKMLSQIAIKSYLKFIYKRKLEIALLQNLIKKIPITYYYFPILFKEFSAKIDVSKIDLKAYTEEFKKAKKYMISGYGSGYDLFYYRLLDYVVPITAQIPLAVSIDLEGSIVNDVYSDNPNYKLTDLHVCIFPQKTKTAVFLFVDNDENKYSKFKKQFQDLDEESKLGVINYLVFLYSEDYFMAKELKNMVDLKVFRDVANKTPVIWDFQPVKGTSVLSADFNLSKWQCIPNLLSEQYKLR